MKNKNLTIIGGLIILFSLIFLPSTFTQVTNDLTITTYFPSPFGEYQKLRAYPTDSPSNCYLANEGAIYFNASGHQMFICREQTSGALVWEPMQNAWWNNSGNDLYSTNFGNVFIGTNAGPSKLTVLGDVAVRNLAHNESLTLNIETGANYAVSLRSRIYGNASGGTTMGKSNAGLTTILHGKSLARHLMIGPGGGSNYNQNLYFAVSKNIATGPEISLTMLGSNGNIGIGTTSPAAALDVNGAIYQRGAVLHADYVFQHGYELESIEDHAKYMWANKHLKSVPKSKFDENNQEVVEIGAHRRGILEELEKAYLYIKELDEEIKSLEKQIDAKTKS